MKYLFPIILCLACSHEKHPAQSGDSDLSMLKSQYDLYTSLAPKTWDEMDTGCDSLLFYSLLNVGMRREADVQSARDADGKWYRIPPPAQTGCSSDISRDMFMGLFTYIWQTKHLDWADQIWDYGVKHNWDMGEERKPGEVRTIFVPQTVGLLATIIKGLGGDDHPEKNYPNIFDTQPGFSSHLTLLHIRLLGLINGSISDHELSALKSIRSHMAGSPFLQYMLHHYTDGDLSEAIRDLTTIWPKDRLPSTLDWCEGWRTQRSDDDSGLKPCDHNQTHSGGDFLFVAGDILNGG